jgi:hypothetical protein
MISAPTTALGNAFLQAYVVSRTGLDSLAAIRGVSRRGRDRCRQADAEAHVPAGAVAVKDLT